VVICQASAPPRSEQNVPISPEKRLQNACREFWSNLLSESQWSPLTDKFSAWAAGSEAVLVKQLPARPSDPPSVGKH